MKGGFEGDQGEIYVLVLDVVGFGMRTIVIADPKHKEPKMTFYAKYPIEGVKRIYEHSIKHPVFTPTFSQLLDAKYRKDGKNFESGKDLWPSADDVDKSKIPAQFFCVKDSGNYLMAATEKTLPGDEQKNFVVYSEGCNPNVDDDYYDRQQAVWGGDDFSEGLPLEWLKIAIENAEKTGTDLMIIKVTKKGLELMTGKVA